MGKLSRTISRSLVTLHQGIPTIPLIVKAKQREVWWYWRNERKSGCGSLLRDKFCESLKHLKCFFIQKERNFCFNDRNSNRFKREKWQIKTNAQRSESLLKQIVLHLTEGVMASFFLPAPQRGGSGFKPKFCLFLLLSYGCTLFLL